MHVLYETRSAAIAERPSDASFHYPTNATLVRDLSDISFAVIFIQQTQRQYAFYRTLNLL